MKVYLDDVRACPVGWELVKTADECIAKLETGRVEYLSLDHDLAPEHYNEEHWEYINEHGYTGLCDRARYSEKTGMYVVDWMIASGVWPRVVIVHSMNPVAGEEMFKRIWASCPMGRHVGRIVGFCRSKELPRCGKAPPGWLCTRDCYHDGPCAADPDY